MYSNQPNFDGVDPRLVGKAIDLNHPALPDLVDGLVEESLAPLTSYRHQYSIDRLDEVILFRTLIDSAAIDIDRFGFQVRNLVRTPHRLAAFLNDLALYQKNWDRPFPELSPEEKIGDRKKQLQLALTRHHASVSDGKTLGFPTAVLIDAWNRSTFGTYVSDRPVVKGIFEGESGDFVTLNHFPLWREAMGQHALGIAQRICNNRERIDLIILGDGSGEMGASIAEQFEKSDRKFRLIHLDISPAMLDRQKLRYTSIGVENENIVSIQGNIMHCRELLRQKAPDLTHGIFILNEIFDDLRTHACWSDRQGGGEMYTLLEEQGTIKTMGFASPEPILKNLPQHLPFYATNSPSPVMRAFCPEAIILLREMLGSIEKGAVLIGDYGWEFISDKPEIIPQYSPYRIFGPDLKKEPEYTEGFDHPCSITADAHPAILYFAEAFGGRVDFLGSAEDFVSAVNRTFSSNIRTRLADCREIFEGRKAVRLREYAEAKSMVNLVAPNMFAGVVVKGV